MQERGLGARPACNVAEPGASGSGKPRLLVVEDESLISRYLADLLGQLGYGVSACVASGHAALEAAARDRPDLAIVDIGLAGGMDGISTACLLRQRFDIPSIFLSGASDAALLARARLAKSPAFIHKPFMPDEIERAVKAAFADRSNGIVDDADFSRAFGGKSDRQA